MGVVAIGIWRSDPMGMLESSMMRWSCSWLESLLHHVGVVTTWGTFQDTMINWFQLLDRHFSSSVPSSIFLIHITAVTMLIWLFSFNGVTLSLPLMVGGRCHHQLIHFKCLWLCYLTVSPHLLRTCKWLESPSQGGRVIRWGMEELAWTILHVIRLLLNLNFC